MMNQLVVQNHRINVAPISGEEIHEIDMDMNNQSSKKNHFHKVRVHRVGTLTLGFILIIFGTMFLLHLVAPQISYQFIFHLWPIILISMGVEVLAANLWDNEEMRYDKGAIALLFVMTFFAMCVAGMELIFSLPWNVSL